MMSIYMFTNSVNGKRYIGKTSRPVEHRLNEHFSGKHIDKMPIVKAIKKHGKDNFSIEILFETDCKDELNLKEIEFINSHKPEYNISPGGEGGALFTGRNHSLISKKLISDSHIGKKHSEETKHKMSIAHTGRKLSEETIQKRVNAQSKNYKFVDPFDTQIEIFNLNKYCRENGLNASGFRALLSKRINSYKGYRRIAF